MTMTRKDFRHGAEHIALIDDEHDFRPGRQGDGVNAKARKALAGYQPSGLHDRIAGVLGWRVSEVQAVSLATLRELVRGSPKLAHELDELIRSGEVILPRSGGARRTR